MLPIALLRCIRTRRARSVIRTNRSEGNTRPRIFSPSRAERSSGGDRGARSARAVGGVAPARPVGPVHAFAEGTQRKARRSSLHQSARKAHSSPPTEFTFRAEIGARRPTRVWLGCASTKTSPRKERGFRGLFRRRLPAEGTRSLTRQETASQYSGEYKDLIGYPDKHSPDL